MEPKGQKQQKKKLVVLRSEGDFYFLIERRLKEAGFELLNIFEKNPPRKVRQASYLHGSIHT